jgi:hypothetical protein
MTKVAILKAINALPTKERMQIVERVIRSIRLNDPVSDNPSPSGDSWFDDPRNIASLDEAIQSAKEDKRERTILSSREEIREFLANL